MLALLALPKFGLGTVFLIAFISATLLPLGSEPAVFGLVKLNSELFWPAVLVATAGNTLGGALTWWMGLMAERAYEQLSHQKPPNARALRWLGQVEFIAVRQRRLHRRMVEVPHQRRGVQKIDCCDA